MDWESETQGPRRGARGEESGRALPGCSRTSAAHCEFPKVPRPFALSTAELQEAPFQGSRRRHLPAAAAKPDGTPAGPAVSSLPGRGGRRRRQVKKLGEEEEEGGCDPAWRGSHRVGRRRGRKTEGKGERGAG